MWGRNDTVTGDQRTRADTPRSTTVLVVVSTSWRRHLLVMDLAHQAMYRLLEFCKRMFADGCSGADEVEPRRHVAVREQGAKTSPEQISGHGGPDGATDGERHLRGHQVGIEDERTPQRTSPDPNPVAPEADEGVAFADPADQAESRARPLSRRDFSTARPARVLMRARNPCLRARRRLLG
jgi:hypothetical protein